MQSPSLTRAWPKEYTTNVDDALCTSGRALLRNLGRLSCLRRLADLYLGLDAKRHRARPDVAACRLHAHHCAVCCRHRAVAQLAQRPPRLLAQSLGRELGRYHLGPGYVPLARGLIAPAFWLAGALCTTLAQRHHVGRA